jgi:hypothetical protein
MLQRDLDIFFAMGKRNRTLLRRQWKEIDASLNQFQTKPFI